jgi:hypothetical protein
MATTDNKHRKHLDVRAALNYLHLVKGKYRSKPKVYTQFLSVMKAFKDRRFEFSHRLRLSLNLDLCHSIDTIGVIKRVSTLFRDHPELLSGFNLFLPPGYRIVVGAGTRLDVVVVHTPRGVRKMVTKVRECFRDEIKFCWCRQRFAARCEFVAVREDGLYLVFVVRKSHVCQWPGTFTRYPLITRFFIATDARIGRFCRRGSFY